MSNLNEAADELCGFLGCPRAAGPVTITVATLNDFGVAQEACAEHEQAIRTINQGEKRA